jgi:hypothetical protein
MSEHTTTTGSDLADALIETWAQQGEEGFLLSDPQSAEIETRTAEDSETGVAYRFRWMPHREIRGDVGELERRGILNKDRDESKLFRDERDPSGRHCFLCRDNIAECHPMERLVPMTLAGREYLAGANFAWIELDHFTVMSAEHMVQEYDRHVLEAMIDLHEQTGGRFRVLFNGTGAGASIPWHLHYQVTTERLPIESMRDGDEDAYPTVVRRFDMAASDAVDRAHEMTQRWLDGDRETRSVNLMVATTDGRQQIYLFPRDQRRAKAEGKGLVGGFEVAGDFVLSSTAERLTFDAATVETARTILDQVRPPDWS